MHVERRETIPAYSFGLYALGHVRHPRSYRPECPLVLRFRVCHMILLY